MLLKLPFLQMKCELCSKPFASKNSLRKHKRNFHKIRTFASEVRIMTQLGFINVNSFRKLTCVYTKLQLKI